MPLFHFQSQVQKKTVEACRSYLDLPHFNRDVIWSKSHAAAGMCDWAVSGPLAGAAGSRLLCFIETLSRHACVCAVLRSWNKH